MKETKCKWTDLLSSTCSDRTSESIERRERKKKREGEREKRKEGATTCVPPKGTHAHTHAHIQPRPGWLAGRQASPFVFSRGEERRGFSSFSFTLFPALLSSLLPCFYCLVFPSLPPLFPCHPSSFPAPPPPSLLLLLSNPSSTQSLTLAAIDISGSASIVRSFVCLFIRLSCSLSSLLLLAPLLVFNQSR